MFNNKKDIKKIRIRKTVIDIDYFPYVFRLNYELTKNYGTRDRRYKQFNIRRNKTDSSSNKNQ